MLAPDFTAPDAPSATVADDGTSVSGMGEAGALVHVMDPDGNVIGSAIVGDDGSYTVTLAQPQDNGGTLAVTQTDASGNVSDETAAPAPDITPPDAPTLDIADDGATVSGTGEAGDTVTITDPDGNVIGTATVAADGTYQATLITAQINGEQLTATQTDPAGNISPQTDATAPDLTPPDAPEATVSDDGSEVTGTGEPGDMIRSPIPTANVIGVGHGRRRRQLHCRADHTATRRRGAAGDAD